MNTPDYLEKAGEIVASVYSQIESELCQYLVKKMIEGDVTGQRSQTALINLTQSIAPALYHLINVHDKEIDAAVKTEVTDAIKRSDRDDLARIKRGLGVELPDVSNRTIAATVAGVKDILARQNLAMGDAANATFVKWSSWAITQVNTGNMTTERAMHAAVRNLAKEGISVITYQNAETGMITVRNKVDVAVRRHIRTQILQDGMRLTETRLDQAGVEFVEVSSHTGARPSHAKWQGRVYSRHGDKVVDGVHYRDFKTACNWGDVADGIGGANCRHSYAAWFPGMQRYYDPNPKHPSGMPNKKVYDLTQKQRYMERQIRATKRELAAAETMYERTKALPDLGEVSRLKLKLRNQQSKIRELIKDNDKVLQRSPRREWAGDMPKVKVPTSSGRKLDEFLETAVVKNSGFSKARIRNAIAEELASSGGEIRDFSALTRAEQQSLFKRAYNKLAGKTMTPPTAAKKITKTMDRNAPVYQGLSTQHVDKLEKQLNKAPMPQAEVWQKYESKLSLLDSNHRGGAHFSADDVGIRLDMNADMNDKKRPAMSTFFHESGHHIDYLVTGDERYIDKVRRYGVANESKCYASTSYQNGKFEKTILDEVDDIIKDKKKEISTRVKELVAKKDIGTLRDEGFISSQQHSNLERLSKLLDDKGYADELKRVTRTAYNKRNVCRTIEKEVRGLSDAQRCDLSDILEGATKGAIQCGWGHGKKYWKDHFKLPKETFAEFYSAYMVNPESLAVLEKWLPQTKAVFDDIIDAIRRGTI